ncbi:hypothetical protein CR3_gp092 [Cronobacter phage CR3]|uniref:Uncharacterized protein n=3 Tax=Certrevirus TaxID=1914850 RepID=I1TRD4_9CAUD|nr:hypothetical protein CR3_gp092 [Cronobacter phage CR3]YP_009042332.1 hypothetical protein HL10_gp095 [Cronobacter phage CR8]YP_009189070.1 hypothetical protein ADU18_0211 [Cronobacter phage PBES 02]KAB3178523.1 hypothetical protein F9047_11400 [Escherichia coli]AFH21257.1 hypothetical protein CR3_092 [Cronobacter phage CR3]AIA64625.1 hypothetical protein CR8_095 [Cronobacter phage CR8]AKY04109.1 hypothetical protein ADU18_0211 [Cronobacter phage PBES 02]
MSRRPEYKPTDYRYQEEIDKSWNPQLKRGDDFWVFNQKTGKVWGPYKFSHYTNLGAVGWCDVPYNSTVKVRYSKGEIVCATEALAIGRQLMEKAREWSRTTLLAEDLKREVEALSLKLKEIESGK